MIAREDIMRVMTEYLHAYGDADVWLQRSQIDEEAFHTVITDLVDTMIAMGKMGSARIMMEGAVASAFSIGFEVGRQFPETPFK